MCGSSADEQRAAILNGLRFRLRELQSQRDHIHTLPLEEQSLARSSLWLAIRSVEDDIRDIQRKQRMKTAS
jgi:hypothetical protein